MRDLPPGVETLVLASWAPKTQASYNSHLRKWKHHCIDKGIDPFKASFKDAISFIEKLFTEQKASYSYIAATRSALSAILPKEEDYSFGKHPNVSRMLKGIFKLRPSLPKHVAIYDANLVLSFIKTLPPNHHLDLEFLTKKLVTLLCLLSGQRAQSIPVLALNFLYQDSRSISLYLPSMLKNTRPGKHQEALNFPRFEEDTSICVVECLTEYIKRTQLIRENLPGKPQQIVLSYAYPHNIVKTSTITRYVKAFLMLAGIDITIFTCHSTRKASTSKASNLGLTLKDINKAAGWFSETTFTRHYKLPIKQSFSRTLQLGSLGSK